MAARIGTIAGCRHATNPPTLLAMPLMRAPRGSVPACLAIARRRPAGRFIERERPCFIRSSRSSSAPGSARCCAGS
ncbi:hypothetical protein C6P75_04275 [Burkholderia multivorans]|nr:hypothetical protein C6P75_04275 [Burkholderia multivorans]